MDSSHSRNLYGRIILKTFLLHEEDKDTTSFWSPLEVIPHLSKRRPEHKAEACVCLPPMGVLVVNFMVPPANVGVNSRYHKYLITILSISLTCAKGS